MTDLERAQAKELEQGLHQEIARLESKLEKLRGEHDLLAVKYSEVLRDYHKQRASNAENLAQFRVFVQAVKDAIHFIGDKYLMKIEIGKLCNSDEIDALLDDDREVNLRWMFILNTIYALRLRIRASTVITTIATKR